MEALEDAFELLHQRAEQVRNALRQRGAGLQMSLQQRRGMFTSILDDAAGGGCGGRPPWMPDSESMASESDWGGDDFEIAPDDSASNISSSRRRRPKRRNEERTPRPSRRRTVAPSLPQVLTAACLRAVFAGDGVVYGLVYTIVWLLGLLLLQLSPILSHLVPWHA